MPFDTLLGKSWLRSLQGLWFLRTQRLNCISYILTLNPPLSNMAVPETRLLGSDSEKRTKWWDPHPIGCMASVSLSMWTCDEKTRKTYRRRATVWKSGEEPPVRNNLANTAISGSTPLELTEINLLCELPTLRASVMQAWINTSLEWLPLCQSMRRTIRALS